MDEKNDVRADGATSAEGTTRPDAPSVIEGPSATTDPDNSRSGNAAYVIFGVAVAALVLLALSLSSCASSLAQFGLSHVDWDSSDYHIDWGDRDELTYGLDGHGDAADIVEELLDQELTRA